MKVNVWYCELCTKRGELLIEGEESYCREHFFSYYLPRVAEIREELQELYLQEETERGSIRALEDGREPSSQSS